MESSNGKHSSSQESFPTRPWNEFFAKHKRQAIKQALDHLAVVEKYREERAIDGEVVEKSGGVCKACHIFTSYKCQNCKDYYCVKDCEHPYWKKHESKCSKIASSELKSPNYKKDTEAYESSSSSSTKHSRSGKKSSENGTTCKGGSTSKSGNTSKGHGRRSEPAMGKHITRFKPPDDGMSSKKRLSFNENELKFKDIAIDNKHSFSGSNTLPLRIWSSAETESAYSKISKHTAKIKDVDPMFDDVNVDRSEIKTVVFFCKDPEKAVHWVMDDDDVKDFELIHKTLASECSHYETVVPEMGLVCGCKFSDEWYRARVIEMQPKCRVHYIDYGNSAEAPSAPLKKLPPEIRMIKSLVYSVELDEESYKKYKNRHMTGKKFKIKTKLVSPAGNDVVEILSDCSNQDSSDSDTTDSENKEEIPTEPVSVMSLIKNNSEGTVSFLPGNSKQRFGLIIPNKSEEETAIDVKETKGLDSAELKSVKAVQGDYVLVVDKDGQRRRGRVVSILCSTYYVLLIDYGIVIPVESVYRLPGRKANLLHLGAMVTIDEAFTEEMKNIEKAVYHVTGDKYSDGRWPCELKEASSKKVIANGYIQSPPEEGVTVPLTLPLKPGTICEISVVTGVRTCFVRPVNKQAARKSLEMSVKMAKSLVKAKSLSAPPKIGGMYAAKNTKDDCFHRVVVKSEAGNKFKVLFVDHGTMEEVTMRDLKPLPVTIKVLPYFAVEVTLSGITVECLSDSAKEYLDILMSKNLALVVSQKDDDGEIVLRERKSGVIVNKVIEDPENGTNFIEKGSDDDDEESSDDNDKPEKQKDIDDVIVPDWEAIRAQSSDDDLIMKKELKFPKIRVNEKYDLSLQYIEDHEFFSSLNFWMANLDDNVFSDVNTAIRSWMAEDSKESRQSYRPRKGEMCLASYEEDWYRGICLGSKNDEFKVFFVDYGNTCTMGPEDLRKMKRIFMQYPACAFKCTIVGVGKLIGKPVLKKTVYKELRRRMNTIFNEVLVQKYEMDVYYVVIPEIEEILSK